MTKVPTTESKITLIKSSVCILSKNKICHLHFIIYLNNFWQRYLQIKRFIFLCSNFCLVLKNIKKIDSNTNFLVYFLNLTYKFSPSIHKLLVIFWMFDLFKNFLIVYVLFAKFRSNFDSPILDRIFHRRFRLGWHFLLFLLYKVWNQSAFRLWSRQQFIYFVD